MTPKQLRQALDRAADECEKQCDAAMRKAWLKYVVPYCEKTGRSFSAGMGSWSFHDSLGNVFNEDDQLPLRLLDVLSEEYPLNRGQSCGSLMPSYEPKKRKGNL